MRTGQVWSDGNEVREETTPAGSLPGSEPDAAETAEVADSRPAAAPPAEDVPSVSRRALFWFVDKGELGNVFPAAASIPQLAPEVALFDAARRFRLPDSKTVVDMDSTDESEDDPTYPWQSGLALALVMLGGLVTNRKDRPRTCLFSPPRSPAGQKGEPCSLSYRC